MPSSRILISSQTLGTNSASVTFSSIPSGYRDLVLRVSARSDDAATVRGFRLNFNGVSGTSYSETYLSGNGSAASSVRDSNISYSDLGVVSGNSTTANTFGSVEIYIPSYTVAQNKPISGFSASEDNATAAFIRANAGLFSNTSAITSIVATLNAGNFASGSSFYLYGLLPA